MRTIGKAAAAFAINAARKQSSRLGKSLVEQIRTLSSALAHAAKAALFTLVSALAHLVRSLVKPALVIGAITAVLLMSTPNETTQNAAPAAPMMVIPPAAHTTPAENAKGRAARVPMPLPNMTRRRAQDAKAPNALLIRFHEGAQTFYTDEQAITALADALNIPAAIPKADLAVALQLARDNAEALRRHTGRYPLPRAISSRLLAAMTPQDVQKLGALLKHAGTLDPGTYTLTAPMASGGLHLEANITVPKATTSSRHCFRYALTFTRRSFAHALSLTACRTGTQWTLLNP